MNLPFYISWRYFFSRTKRSFIHNLSLFSMGMVAVGTMALIVGTSAFNGMESLLRSQYAAFDPAISLRPKKGYTFSFSDSLAEYLSKVRGVSTYSLVLEDYALVSYRGKQEIVRLRGISPTFLSTSALRQQLRQGDFSLEIAGQPQALIGTELQRVLSVQLHLSEAPQIQLFYPTEQLGLNPQSLYVSCSLPVVGSIAVKQQDKIDYVLVPIDIAQVLVGDSNRCTSVSLRLQPSVSADEVARKLRKDLSDKYQVLTRVQQHASLYKLLRIEKFFVVLAFVFILGVASLGLFFVLLMLFLEKRSDMGLLRALGAKSSLLGSIFLWEGLLISLTGSGVGLVLGLILCFLQQHYGLISLGMQSSRVAYPVEVRVVDVFLALGCVIGLTLLAAFRPAWLAGTYKRFSLRQQAI